MQVPFQLGRYKVVGQVGAGGFATVYRAKVEGDMGFSRDVALKVLHPHITSESPDVVAMLADEARLLARMQHPNIVYVQWFGRMANPDGGELFGMTMEYVEGRSWRSVLHEAQRGSGGVPLSVILDVHTDIARGLDFAHRLCGDDGHPLGLVHRDLKPDNIMVSSRGVVKLLDFGIAKARDRLARATETDLVRGTVHYMSPEQVYGVKDLDFRSDLFSFGAMLFEAVVGERLIRSDGVIPAVREIADFDPTPRLAFAAAACPALVPVLTRLVAKEREDRFATTSALVEALVQARGGVAAEQPTTAWLAARAEPLGDTVAVRTPADLRSGPLSETVDIHTGDTTAKQSVDPATVPPPAGTETRPMASAVPRSKSSGATIGAVLVLLGIVLGTLLPSWLADDADAPVVDGPADPTAAPTDPEVPPGPADPEDDPSVETDAVAALEAGEVDAAAGSSTGAAVPDREPRATTADSEAAMRRGGGGGGEAAAGKTSSAVPPAPPVEPVAAAIEPAVPGTARLAANYDFRVVIAGTSYTQLQARKGIELPPGRYTASFTCLNCPAGVTPNATLAVAVVSGERSVSKVTFEGTP